MNERADEQAELGWLDDKPEISPGPQSIDLSDCECVPRFENTLINIGEKLPRDSAPNRSLLEKTAASNTLRAVKKRSSQYVTDLLHHKAGATVSRTIRLCTPAGFGA